jgi:hypothetical protein
MHDMPNRENNPKDQPQQPERRRQERRQDDPNEERRRQEPHQNPQMAQGGNRMTPDSLPEKEKGNWADENFQASQAQKGQGQTKEQGGSAQRHQQNPSSGNPSSGNPSSGNPSSGRETAPDWRDKGFNPQGPETKRESGEKGNSGERRDSGFGRGDEAHKGAGGKIDPSQRDMGQSGQKK